MKLRQILAVVVELDSRFLYCVMAQIADIYISISMETFEHRKYKTRGEGGNS